MIGLADFQISTLLHAATTRSGYSRLLAGRAKGVRERAMNPGVSALLEGVEFLKSKGPLEGAVTCLITDSRRVVPGALFFAIGGLRTDGNFYIEEAVDRGAVAIITEQDLGGHFPIDFVQVADVRVALAAVAREFYGCPDERLGITGITGTNGKTTVSMLVQHLIGGDDEVGLIGTVRYDIGKRTLPSFRTTPESVDVFALLSQMEDGGCKDVVMEVSSHGVDQKRIYGLDFDVGVFLNLTQDHMDYHQTMEAYYEAKKGLFNGRAGSIPRKVVVNVDCPYGRRLCGELPADVEQLTFGEADDALVRASSVRLLADRSEFELSWPGGSAQVVSPLLGRFNVSNLLAALATALANGYAMDVVLARVASFNGVPGRMERVDAKQGFNVLVDYAHTDDALLNATGMLREITGGQLIVVFGCGGDRDRSKRPLMLKAVLTHADRVFATSDNPRSEALEQIFTDMHEGVESGLECVEFIEDRKQAISLALDAAGADDCVLIAGKGHESFQEFDGTVIPFDDRQVTRELIALKSFNMGGA